MQRVAAREPKWWADPTPGRIFRLARAVDNGVELRSPPRWRNATAVISPTGLILEHGDAAAIALWTDDSWRFVRWDADRNETGLGVAHREAAATLHPTWSWPVRSILGRHRQLRHSVPLEAMAATADRASDRVQVLEALRRLLAARPDACNRLNERNRCERLADDLRTWYPDGGLQGSWRERQRIEAIGAAARITGSCHVDGRPLPDWEPPDVEPVIEGIVRQLDVSHTTRRLAISEGEVRDAMARYYFDVRPWPLAALVEA